jgi:hypothetical protein
MNRRTPDYFFSLRVLRFCSSANLRSNSDFGTWTNLDMNAWNLPNGESGEGFGVVAIHCYSNLKNATRLCVLRRSGVARATEGAVLPPLRWQSP